MKRYCPNCGDEFVICPECGEVYSHGEYSHCIKPACIEVNAPLDCNDCGLTVSNDKKGVLTLSMKLMRYE